MSQTLSRNCVSLVPAYGTFSPDLGGEGQGKREFKPQQWKPNFPMEAFQNMTDRDGYWAAKIVASFTDEQIRAAVETGELSDPKAAEYLTQQLIKRRDAIVREYFNRNAALDELQLQQASNGWVLNCTDLKMQVTRNADETTYEYQLSAADDAKRVLACVCRHFGGGLVKYPG